MSTTPALGYGKSLHDVMAEVHKRAIEGDIVSDLEAEDITRGQLHVYAVGFQELTGQNAQVLEVLNLDEKGQSRRELVNDDLLVGIKGKIAAAGADLRANRLPRLGPWCKTCDDCDLAGLCRSRP
jgi:DNA helicase II / ATP-dependent DNA helicase PcrA